MRSIHVLAAFFGLTLILFGCSGGRLTEQEYIDEAGKMLAEGNIEDAIYSYQNLINYYPESEKKADYEAKLLELTIEAAEKLAGTPKGETYMAEAISLAERSSDTLGYWVRFLMAEKKEGGDADAAAEVFARIPVKGYYQAAQVALGRGDFQMSIAAYEKLTEYHPDSPDNYKAIFLIGFSYSEYLENYEKARGYFEEVIEKYPDCDLADDAAWMLENMGKPPEDIEFIEEDAGAEESA